MPPVRRIHEAQSHRHRRRTDWLRFRLLSALLLVPVAGLSSLTGCGGSGGHNTTGPPEPPPPPPLSGEIAFLSNPVSGISSVYALRLPDTTMRRVTPSSVTSADAPRWSPDGSKLVFWGVEGPNSGIYVVNADGSGLVSQASDNYVPYETYSSPTWSPDGATIAFVAHRYSSWRILAKRLDSQNRDTLVTLDGEGVYYLTWSPDGSRIAYSRKGGSYDGRNLAVTQLNTGNTLDLTPRNDSVDPAWSPDGSTIAFSANGRIQLINPDGTNLRVVTSPPATSMADRLPAWSPDGSRIVFTSTRAGNINELYVVDADGGNLTRLTNNGVAEWAPTWRR